MKAEDLRNIYYSMIYIDTCMGERDGMEYSKAPTEEGYFVRGSEWKIHPKDQCRLNTVERLHLLRSWE